MSNGVNVKVIKPPTPKVTFGTIFKPSKAFLHKSWLKQVSVAVLIWISANLGVVFLSNFLSIVEPIDYPSSAQLLSTWLVPVNYWVLGIDLLWLVPTILLTPIYIRSIEYSVKAESGETMPEIYVKKGIFTITRNHVPFRTITNISSQAGIFDRMFGIGSVHIETAGKSGQDQSGPEENMEGIVFYEEVRDFILKELRKLTVPYVTTTEPMIENKPLPVPVSVNDELVGTLRDIKVLLKEIRDTKQE
jgi:uncharacterized membrane protein YdbT with pleckstrin-like domain